MIVSFPGYTPPPRYDDLPWTTARLEQSATETGVYVLTEDFDLNDSDLGGLDTDPANPQTRNFTTTLGTADLWYRITWIDADGNQSGPTAPGQNTSGTLPGTVDPYATYTELATILQVNAATNQTALERVLIAAAGEINSELGRTDLAGWELELAAQVNLARAEELWKQMKAPWGVIGLDSEFGATRIARDTFERHAMALAPLKRWTQAGLA